LAEDVVVPMVVEVTLCWLCWLCCCDRCCPADVVGTGPPLLEVFMVVAMVEEEGVDVDEEEEEAEEGAEVDEEGDVVVDDGDGDGVDDGGKGVELVGG